MTVPSVVVQWSPTTAPFATPVWVDITAYNRRGWSNRGRSFEQDEYTAGSAEVVLDNRTRLFDPDYSSGTWYGSLLPGKRMRISHGYYYEALRLAPTAYYRMSETSGSFLNGGSGTSIDLAVTGSDLTRSQTGALGGSTNTSISMNAGGGAGNTYLGPSAYNASQAVNNTFTYSGWFKSSVAAQQTLWARGAGTTAQRIGVRSTGNVELVQGTFGGTNVATTTGVNVLDGAWHHIVVTKNGTGASDSHIYVDGVEASYSARNAYTFVNTSHGWWLGAWNFFGVVEEWQGHMDEVAVWISTALTAEQVARLYSTGMNDGEGVLFHGFVEGWPQSWPEAGGGRDSEVTVPLTDLVGWISSWKFEHGAYTREQLDDDPWLCWRLGDTPSVRYGQVIDCSGNHRHGIFDDGGGGPDTLDPNADSLIAFEDDGAMEWGTSEFAPGVVSYPGDTGLTNQTVECWVKFPAGELYQPSTIWYHMGTADTSGFPTHTGSHNAMRLKCRNDPTALQLVYWDGAQWVVGSVRGPEVFDGKPHHIVATQNASTWAVVLYIDAVPATLTTANLSESPFGNAGGFFLGAEGQVSTSSMPVLLPPNYETAQCVIDGVAVYGSVLSASRVLAHYKAGTTPWKTDDTGSRIGRVLDWIGWPSSDRDLDTGVSIFDAAAVAGANIVSYIQRLARSEGGRFFCAANLTPTFRNRHDQFTDTVATTVQATFRDKVDGTEDGDDLPYISSGGITMDFDRTLMRNRVTAKSAQVEVTWEDATSVAAYGPQSEELDLDEARWWDLMGAAQWFVRTYGTPTTRVSGGMRISPYRLPTAALRSESYGTLVRLDLGHRVSFVRTPTLGSAITKTCRVEGIRHEWGDGFLWTNLSVSAAQVDTTTVWTLGTTGLDEARLVW